MAYMCMKDYSRECDSCGDCTPKKEYPPETGVTITAKIELKYTVYGNIEKAMRLGDMKLAEAIAEELVEDTIDCCGLAGEDMTVEEIEFELNE